MNPRYLPSLDQAITLRKSHASIALPDARGPAAFYLAVALDARSPFLTAPAPVIHRLYDLGFVERAAFLPNDAHAIAWLDVDAMESSFAGFQWARRDVLCATVDRFIEEAVSWVVSHRLPPKQS
jgi:hypothetical protein